MNIAAKPATNTIAVPAMNVFTGPIRFSITATATAPRIEVKHKSNQKFVAFFFMSLVLLGLTLTVSINQ
jgi:hypothetical protein